MITLKIKIMAKRKSNQPKGNLYDVLEVIYPKRAIERTRQILEDCKKLEAKRTVPYSSTKYGFRSKLIIYLPPKTPKALVVQKFSKRLNETIKV